MAIGFTDPDIYDRLVAPREAAVAAETSNDELDQRRRDAVDLQTASESDEPCIAFASALARVDRAGEPRDLELLGEVAVPSARARDDATLAVRTRLAKLVPARR